MSAITCTQLYIVLCTCPDTSDADRIALSLVKEHLAACVTKLPAGRSTYEWNNQLVTEQEIQLLIKTTQANLTALFHRLKTLHPYKVPEAIALPIADGLPDYMNWVIHQTQSDQSAP